jgi:hypothetical protein
MTSMSHDPDTIEIDGHDIFLPPRDSALTAGDRQVLAWQSTFSQKQPQTFSTISTDEYVELDEWEREENEDQIQQDLNYDMAKPKEHLFLEARDTWQDVSAKQTTTPPTYIMESGEPCTYAGNRGHRDVSRRFNGNTPYFR